MDHNQQHPLAQLTCGNSLSMLEMLIPYVDYPFKLPLALFIKFNEMRIIINTLQNMELINRYGLHHAGSSPMDMLSSLTGISPDMLQMLMSMSENSFFGTGAEPPFGTQNPFQDFLSGLAGSMPFDPSAPPPPPSYNEPGFPPEQPDQMQDTGGNPYDFDSRINRLFEEYDKQI